MTRFFSADHHFGHANIIRFCDRPFSSVDEMDSVMISKWNARVSHGDEVIYAGDFMMGKDAMRYLSCLNGKILFVPGGHDKRWIKAFDWERQPRFKLLQPIHEINIGRHFTPPKLVICHYPLLSWEAAFHGAYQN
jgi:calcineurin-like phosphoesterase family protein